MSFFRDNIKNIQTMPYKVSWKADGTRYMMLIDGLDRVFFADRDHCIFKVDNLNFRDRKAPDQYLKDTLVDGEMVVDEFEGVRTPRYLIYDAIMFKAGLLLDSCFDNVVRRPGYSRTDRIFCERVAKRGCHFL